MKKEKLKLDNIKQDLKIILNRQMSNVADWRFSYIIPITLLALIIGFVSKKPWIGLLIFSIPAYHIVQYVIEYKKYKEQKRVMIEAIGRGAVAISVEQFSHIAVETVYEPHRVGTRGRATKTVKMFCFSSGAFWRVPLLDRHYEWSKDFFISTKGLENISISGDDFFYISLQEDHDIAYIYPCKNFELDSSLVQQH